MPNETMDQTLERIAREELELTTLETRGDDTEDFHRLAVWEIATVMERAYQAGFEAAENEFARRWPSGGETPADGGSLDRSAEVAAIALRKAAEALREGPAEAETLVVGAEPDGGGDGPLARDCAEKLCRAVTADIDGGDKLRHRDLAALLRYIADMIQ